MALYRDEAVVLRTYKLGEADRIIVLFSRGRGKIRAVAKGVRRTKSRFGSRLEPGSVVSLQLFEGRNLDTVTQVEQICAHSNIRSNLENYGRAAIVLETVDAVAQQGDTNPALYKLLTGALAELDRSANAAVVSAFVGRLLALEGVQPSMEVCVGCGSETDLVAIDLAQGGVLCRGCRQGRPISSGARQAFASVLAGRVRHVLDTASPEVCQELEALSAALIEQHIERRLRSATVIYDQF